MGLIVRIVDMVEEAEGNGYREEEEVLIGFVGGRR
jgi:hypothetical protein